MAAMTSSGGVMDTNVETITSFIMRELKDRELAVFMNAMQVWREPKKYFVYHVNVRYV